MGSAAVLEIASVAKFGLEIMDRYQRGEMTDEEVEEAWQQMKDRWDSANDLWERAGGKNG